MSDFRQKSGWLENAAHTPSPRTKEGDKDLFVIGHRSLPMGLDPIRWVGVQICLEALRVADQGSRNRLARMV